MALDGAQLKALLAKIDANLETPGTICVIGSGATILLGQEARQTDDIDVWADASRIALGPFRAAVEAAGLGFDPTDAFPRIPYIQVVHPGIVHVPGWNPSKRSWLGEAERQVWAGARLTVTTPPPRVIVASKLVRGDDRDLEDCLWLMTAHGVEAHDIMKAIRALPGAPREQARENFDMLGMMKR